MNKWSIQPDGVLDKDDDISPQRELFVNRMVEVSLKVEAYDEEAYEIFNGMPANTLPPLPWGYLWAHHQDEHSIIRETASDKHRFQLILYGPNASEQINFLFQVDHVTTYSFAHINKSTGPGRLPTPMSDNDYRVPEFDYSRTRFKRHVKGHLIDHHDTIQIGPREYWSANDARNFVPEPPEYEWGLGIRNQKVRALRRLNYQTAYSQFSIFPDDALQTNDGSYVPEEVLFTSYRINGGDYIPLDVIDVNWEENMKRPPGQKVVEHATKKLSSSLEASPIVKFYSPDDSDRGLRYESRDHKKTADRIADRSIKARFPRTAELFARYGAADREFEQINNKFRAGIAADNSGRIHDAIQNVNRTLDFGEELSELDEDQSLVTKNVKRETLKFFRNKDRDGTWEDADLDDITDRLESICHV